MREIKLSCRACRRKLSCVVGICVNEEEQALLISFQCGGCKEKFLIVFDSSIFGTPTPTTGITEEDIELLKDMRIKYD